MQIPLFVLLFASTLWTGSWKILTEKEEVMHLVVTNSGTIELYDSTWTPNEIQRVTMDETSIDVRAVVFDSTQPLRLRGERTESTLTGTLSVTYPQWSMSIRIRGKKVGENAFPPPVEWIARHRKGNTIDLMGYLLENAPREDYESFARFWDEAVEPSFYIFLDEFLYPKMESPFTRKERLEELFVFLQHCSAKSAAFQATLEPNASQAGSGSSADENRGRRTIRSKEEIDCVVLVPALISERSIRAIASIKNTFPPGHRPCCGESLYTLENFLIQPVECPLESSPESSETSTEPTSGSTGKSPETEN